jgi:hypothetical protein
MDTVVEQINALREAFSADVNKPFELKAAFPFGSPQLQAAELPILSPMSFATHPQENTKYTQPSQVRFALVTPLTPPSSANDVDSTHADSSVHQSVGMMASGHSGTTNASPAAMMQAQWNPSRLWE